MTRVGIRELRQRASELLRLMGQGETVRYRVDLVRVSDRILDTAARFFPGVCGLLTLSISHPHNDWVTILAR
jgi:hypothetical protein